MSRETPQTQSRSKPKISEIGCRGMILTPSGRLGFAGAGMGIKVVVTSDMLERGRGTDKRRQTAESQSSSYITMLASSVSLSD